MICGEDGAGIASHYTATVAQGGGVARGSLAENVHEIHLRFIPDSRSDNRRLDAEICRLLAGHAPCACLAGIHQSLSEELTKHGAVRGIATFELPRGIRRTPDLRACQSSPTGSGGLPGALMVRLRRNRSVGIRSAVAM
jgi:hypothetical protein